MHRLLLLCVLACGVALTGCMTRTEFEYYTLAVRDTTVVDAARNAPGERENGVIYPSSREQDIHREYVTEDSLHKREYPAFLRLGAFEFAGLFTPAQSPTMGDYYAGFLGVYGYGDSLSGKPHLSHTFRGGIFRLMPYEARIRWFRDSPDWTIGTYLFEAIAQDYPYSASILPDEPVMSIFPVYVRKRFFLRREVPYVMAQPTFGIGLFPWQYVNLGGTFDVGSIGGMNLHAYAGFVAAVRPRYFTSTGVTGRATDSTRTASFPYIGLGVSVLDFVNTQEELDVEWKDQKNYSLEISAVDFSVIHSFGSEQSIFDTTKTVFPTGIHLRVASVAYPMWPVWKNAFVGTSLMNWFVLAQNYGGLGILPLRAGVHIAVAPDELVDQAYIEYNYYPSQFLHIANRLSLDLSRVVLGLTLGYVTGSPGAMIHSSLIPVRNDFSGLYMGLGVSLGDNIFDVDKLTKW